MKDLERFLRRLVEVLEARDPAGVHRPISIADLRRTVLPYRLNRSALRLSSAEDYEMMVLRLIAEEGGYVRTFPPESAERAREEVGALHPDVDLVEFLGDATIQIGAYGLARLIEHDEPAGPARVVAPPGSESGRNGLPANPELAITDPTASEEEAGSDEPVSPNGSDPAEPVAAASPVAEADPGADPEPEFPEFEPIADDIEVDEAAPEDGSVGVELPEGRSGMRSSVAICPFCSSPLPTHREVSFCPYCGDRLGPRRCARCGSDVEKGWRHCISCGHSVGVGESS